MWEVETEAEVLILQGKVLEFRKLLFTGFFVLSAIDLLI